MVDVHTGRHSIFPSTKGDSVATPFFLHTATITARFSDELISFKVNEHSANHDESCKMNLLSCTLVSWTKGFQSLRCRGHPNYELFVGIHLFFKDNIFNNWLKVMLDV